MIQNEKCKQLASKTFGYCDRVNLHVPKSFCAIVCRGEPEVWCRESVKDARLKRLSENPVPKSEKDKELVTVFIPTIEGDAAYLERTIKSVKENASGPIEIFVVADGWEYSALDGEKVLNCPKRIGLRAAMNIIAEKASGKYIVKLDGHCALTPEWDIRLKSVCNSNTVVVPAVDMLDEKTWQGSYGDMSFATLDGNLQMRYIRPYETVGKCPLETDIITMTACCWIMETEYYKSLGGCDEELGMWGNLGAEWALKVWLTGGRLLLRADVVCSHLFRKKAPFTIDILKKVSGSRKLCQQWIIGTDRRRTRTPGWLVEKFAYINNRDIPLFGLGGKGHSIRRQDWDFLKSFIEQNNIKNVLEFGSGKSTLMFDNLGCNVASYDTIPFFVDTVQALSSEKTRVLQWDDCISIKEQFDLLFIDGPAGGENREKSYEIGSQVNTKFIACHDANRKWETLWAEKYLADRKLVASSPDNIVKIYG